VQRQGPIVLHFGRGITLHFRVSCSVFGHRASSNMYCAAVKVILLQFLENVIIG
jgi:hypothetical protein